MTRKDRKAVEETRKRLLAKSMVADAVGGDLVTVDQAADRYAREKVLPKWMDSYDGGPCDHTNGGTTMEVKHSPGEWVVDSDGRSVFAVDDYQSTRIATVFGGGSKKNVEAFVNATLIAAAPELLAACRAAVAWAESDEEMNRVTSLATVVVTALAAIAKATA